MRNDYSWGATEVAGFALKTSYTRDSNNELAAHTRRVFAEHASVFAHAGRYGEHFNTAYNTAMDSLDAANTPITNNTTAAPVHTLGGLTNHRPNPYTFHTTRHDPKPS